ncbi:MAG TPA: transglutaminase family protein, partial [Isosphaeraceae bacterium]|nr:transglutaminase family protein [Isosphaeraceae bacterium]
AVRSTTIVQTHRRPGPARLADVPWPDEEPVAIEAIEFLTPSPLVDRSSALSDLLASLPGSAGSVLGLVEQVMDAVNSRLKYEKKVTTARTPLSEALALGRGVCQDFAHLSLGAFRGLGVPARYVSGYLNGPGELATHAWCQVWGGRAGWVDVDPTHSQFVTDDYVVTAVGRDFSDVPPNRGVWKGKADETINVAVQVEPIDRPPPDWSDWGEQAPWLGSSWTQFQRQGRRSAPSLKAGYRQQQSQQQQE